MIDTPTIMGIGAAALIGIGLYGVIVPVSYLRRIVACNILGGGIFLLFGVIARRGADGAFAADPVPQAFVITGMVVAFAATVLAVTLLERLTEGVSAESAEPQRGAIDTEPAQGADES